MKSLLSNLPSLAGRRATRLLILLVRLLVATSFTFGLWAVSAGGLANFGPRATTQSH